MHTKCSLYECTSVQSSKIFKQNWIISICSPAWGWGMDGWGCGHMGYMGVWGVPYACQHMHACTHICMYKHDNFNCKWLPPWVNPWGNPMMSYVHTCMCMHQAPHTPTPTNTHIHLSHPPLMGDPIDQLKHNKTWTKLRYFNSVWRFDNCGDSPTYVWVYGLVGGWVHGWVHVKSLKI